MTPTPRTEAAQHEGLLRGNPIPTLVTTAEFARQLERDITELNERLMERQETLMTAIVALKEATQLLTRCHNAATSPEVRRYTRGQVEIDLYEDVQSFLHTQPSYRCYSIIP